MSKGSAKVEPAKTYIVLGQEVPRAEHLVVVEVKRPRRIVVLAERRELDLVRRFTRHAGRLRVECLCRAMRCAVTGIPARAATVMTTMGRAYRERARGVRQRCVRRGMEVEA